MSEFNDKVIRLQQLEIALRGLQEGIFGRGIKGGTPKTCPVDRTITSLRAEIEAIETYFNQMV